MSVWNWSHSRLFCIRCFKPLSPNHLVSRNLSIPGAYTVLHICLISSRVAADIAVGGAGGGGDIPLIQRSSSILVRFAVDKC